MRFYRTEKTTKGRLATMLKEGSKAPDFRLPGTGGKEVALGDLKGHYVVLYFYPKDDTSGCTKEALDFSATRDAFEALNAQIIGISPDSPESHAKFAGKHALGLTLLADEDKSVIKAYGAWAEKKMYGKSYMGVDRSTFLIAPDGRLIAIWRSVKVAGHAAEVLDVLKKASAKESI
jgi:peroxiredoxin Q/BCP